jgi:predicted deacetylase
VQRFLVVSIHDLAPVTRPQVEQILARLAQNGVDRCSLLVVPDYHHRGRSLADPAFTRWLHDLDAHGHELVIHGFYHERKRRAGDSPRQKLITRIYTADEGEFYDLNYVEALHLLQEARNEFARQGFSPAGFVAPAWLLGPDARQAAIAAGFRYTTTLRGVWDFLTGNEFLSQSLVYSVRSDWRCATSLLWNRFLFYRLIGNPLLRLSIHPRDIEHSGIWRQIEALVNRARRDRGATTYRAWLEQASPTARRAAGVR